MPKLDSQYLTLTAAFLLPMQVPKPNESRSHYPTIKNEIDASKITLLTQIKGSFQPLATMKKDLVDTFKPYRSIHHAIHDAHKPLYALGNFVTAIAYTLVSLLLFIVLPIYFIFPRNRPKDVNYLPMLGGGYVYALSWFIHSVLSAIQNATQLITAPLTWLIKIPLRKLITAFSKADSLLIENRKGIRNIINKASELSPDDNKKDLLELENLIQNKYTKALGAGEFTRLSFKPEQPEPPNLYPYLKLFGWNPDRQPNAETQAGLGIQATGGVGADILGNHTN